MTLNLSSKLGKLSALVPRFLKIYGLKGVSAARFFARSPQVRQLRTQTVSLSRTAYRLSIRTMVRMRSIVIPRAKSAFKTETFRPLKIATFTLIKVSVPTYSRRALSFVTPKSKNLTRPSAVIKAPWPGVPLKNDLAKFSNDLENAADQFASLPMWFTLPLLLGSSFAVGIIVSYLM